MAVYSVLNIGKHWPTSDDAVAVGLRVLRDGEYFQYFLAAVSGVEVMTMDTQPSDRWWGALARAGAERIKQQVVAGTVEHPADPTASVVFFVTCAEVIEIAQQDDRPLAVTGEDDWFRGLEVHAFEA